MGSESRESGVKLYSVSQIRQIELNFAKLNNTSTYPLMEAAGHAIYLQIKQNWPDANNILILTGKGNNGGDGFVIARLAAQENKKVTLCHLNPDSIKTINGEAKPDHLIAFEKITNDPRITWSKQLPSCMDEFDIIIDAMLGTGIKGAVREPYIDVIKKVNQLKKLASRKPSILAVDVPSGLNADTGFCFDEAIKADVTMTLVGHKKGLFTGQAANYCGKVRLLNLEVAETCFQDITSKTAAYKITAENWRSLSYQLEARKMDAHKGDFGHCFIIGGAKGMTGAAILAATAAARSGSGLTSARLEKNAVSLLQRCPEVMAKNVSLGQIEQEVKKLNANSLVLGPGLGKEQWAKQWMALLSLNPKILAINKVWDADALNWLAENPDFDEKRILTPHLGEASRLLAISTQEVNQDRFSASKKIAQKYGGICVLKGSGTIISDSNGQQIACAVGNPGMASGGMGDVLSGIIGSLLAQGLSLISAATLGVCIHGEAADRAAGPANHYRGLLASDLFVFLPELLNP